MRLRANQIVVAVLVLTAGILGSIFWATLSPGTSGSSDDDFLRSVREDASKNLDAAKTEVGGVPPGGLDDSKKPVIEVADTFDAGTIPNDQITTKTMMIRNSGTFELVIGQITTQCACTVGTVEKKEVPPGGEIPMTIVLDPRRIPGFESTKMLTIFSNDPQKSMATVNVTAKVEQEFSVEPEQVELGQVAKGESVTAQVVFRQLQDAPFAETPFEIKAIKVSEENRAIQASVSPRPEAEWAAPGHREYVVDLTFDSSLAPVGPFDAVLSADTTCKRLFNYRVFVHGEVVEGAAAAPVEKPA